MVYVDLSDLWDGDRVFSSCYGWGEVQVIQTKRGFDGEKEQVVQAYFPGSGHAFEAYHLNGHDYHLSTRHPTLFHSIEECKEYWYRMV